MLTEVLCFADYRFMILNICYNILWFSISIYGFFGLTQASQTQPLELVEELQNIA